MSQNETLNHDFLGDDPVRGLYILMIQSKKLINKKKINVCNDFKFDGCFNGISDVFIGLFFFFTCCTVS